MLGGNQPGVGGRAARTLRLLLFLVLALGAVEYVVVSIMQDPSTIKTYLYVPANSSLRNSDNVSTLWPKSSANASYSETPINKTVTRITTSIKTPILLELLTNSSNESNKSRIVPTSTHNRTIITNFKLKKAPKKHSIDIKKKEERSNKDTTEKLKLPLCDKMPPNLGPINVNMKEVKLSEVEKLYPEVRAGGIYNPSNCTARHRVAIIVPYRDREEHLAIFLRHMHPFLMKQQIHYGIFIVEQDGDSLFNRAKLMNVGFEESQKLHPDAEWECYVFHDIDLLPMDERNLYTCPRQPRHMSAAIDKFGYKLPYYDIFGGVSALTVEQFLRVNGFSNRYWGWGGEDDDMAYRLRRANYHIARYKMSIARYAMMHHKPTEKNPKRWQLLAQTHRAFRDDGLSDLNYELSDVYLHSLYTHIVVNIDTTS